MISDKFENLKLYLKLYYKKLRDMRLKLKIRWSLILVTVCACIAIGGVSYRISEKVIIDKSKNMAINLVKQIGLNLDERIDAFADTSYRILQTASINKILYYDEAEALADRKDSDEDLCTAILQQSSLYSYTKFALLRPNNGVTNEYYKPREKKLKNEKEEEILDYLQKYVTIARPVNWVVYEDQVYFVRKIVKAGGTDLGIMCLAMTDNFFSFVGTEQEYLSNDSIVIQGADDSILKKDIKGFSDEQIEAMAGYKDGDYYVYTSVVKEQGERYVAIALNTKENDWCIIGFLSYDKLLGGLNYIFLVIVLILVAVILIASFIASIIAGTISRNVTIIEQGMRHYEDGDFSVRLKPDSYDETGMLVLQMNYMGMKIGELIDEVTEKEKAKQEAEYKTVLAQINPHFLYNTLGSLKWASWRRKETETAESIDALINLLRFTIKRASSVLPLQEEVDYIRNYILIEEVRYANAFRMDYEIDEAVMGWQVPGFLLQPFIENALIHGLDMTQEDSCIVLRGYEKENMLCLEIEDNGVGMDEETLARIWTDEKAETKRKGYNSIGVKIVESRLKNYYGDNFEIRIYSWENHGTRVVLKIPREQKEDKMSELEQTK